jgi:hypothetical protein
LTDSEIVAPAPIQGGRFSILYSYVGRTPEPFVRS